MPWKIILIIVAILLFILAAFAVSFLGLNLGWVGLAVLAASMLVGK